MAWYIQFFPIKLAVLHAHTGSIAMLKDLLHICAKETKSIQCLEPKNRLGQGLSRFAVTLRYVTRPRHIVTLPIPIVTQVQAWQHDWKEWPTMIATPTGIETKIFCWGSCLKCMIRFFYQARFFKINSQVTEQSIPLPKLSVKLGMNFLGSRVNFMLYAGWTKSLIGVLKNSYQARIFYLCLDPEI